MTHTPNVHDVRDRFLDAHVKEHDYALRYSESVASPESYWGQRALTALDWHKPFARVKNTSFAKNHVSIKWFEQGYLNVSENCVDRHAKTHPESTAIIWEPDNPSQDAQHISYKELHERVQRCANMLKALEAKQDEPITIYMPMVPEAVVAMLACARLGVPHSVVFGGFSPKALRDRIRDCGSKIIITADEGRRGGKTIPLKANVDAACEGLDIKHVLTLVVTGATAPMKAGRDVDWHTLEATVDAHCAPVYVESEHPLFILYTSGSTGSPKGLVHSSAGYLLYAQETFIDVFNYNGSVILSPPVEGGDGAEGSTQREASTQTPLSNSLPKGREDKSNEVFWCTADIGWVTGHSYMVYGPLAAGATTLIFEGVPTYPDASRCWDIVEKHSVNQFYTAPTAIRALMKFGDDPVTKHDRSSLRVLGSVGEPIGPEAWEWYFKTVGEGRCAIVDTYWQTETGGHVLTPLVGVHTLKPGAATQPYFGIKPCLKDVDGHTIPFQGGENISGALCISDSWPGQARTIWNDHQRFVDTYFSAFEGVYFTGDMAHLDEENTWWIQGRMDDVINVSGHRIGTAEVEAALAEHHAVIESAVVGVPHDVKGQGLFAFLTLRDDATPAALADVMGLLKQLNDVLREDIGPIAALDYIQIAGIGLPKTRSGKIMRRILRKIANGEILGKADYEKLGDMSTLLDVTVIDELVSTYKLKSGGGA